MEFCLLAQNWIHGGWAFPTLAIIGLAALIWLLSWLLFPATESSVVSESLQGLEGLDARMARRLREFGIGSDRDLIRLSSRGQQELKSQLDLHDGEYASWREQILRRWRSTYLPEQLREIPDIYPDPELGGLYSKKPARVDPLNQLPGIDQLTAERLQSAGIYTYQQLRLLTTVQQASFRRRFKLEAFDFRQVPSTAVEAAKPAAGPSSHQAAPLPPSAVASAPASETELDSEIGELYVEPPARQDDLTLLEGVDDEAAARLNQGGVYTFDQLRPLTPHQQIQFRQRFSLPQIDFADWKHVLAGDLSRMVDRAGGDANHAAGASAVASTESTALASGETPPSSTAITAATTSEAATGLDEASDDLGYVYTNPPLKPDDLTQLDGVSAAKAERLNAAGIFTLSQLRSLNAQQRKNVRQRFELEGLDFEQLKPISANPLDETQTETQADTEAEMQAEAQADTTKATTVVDDDLGRLYIATPAKPDDLTRLQGIDVTKSSRMKAAGIYRFRQLKSLNATQQTALADRFDLQDVDFADWQRCISAWERGIETVRADKQMYPTGWLHSVRLPEIVPGIFDGQQLVAYPEQVVFRGSNPVFWGQDIQSEQSGVMRALPAASIRSDINYVRIRRVDTRQSAVTSITKGQLFAEGAENGAGWHGLCDDYFGGRHLGIFAREVPHEIEIKLGSGGWGFGHRFGHNDRQEYGWCGRIIDPTAFEISVGHIGSKSGTTLFRGSDPSIWNQQIRNGDDCWAIPVETVKHPIRFVRLLRVDAGQGVIVRADASTILRRSENRRLGWNGENELFSGAYHLGVFHRDAPQDVEVCFGKGGWGFGHPFGENDHQAFGWAGRAMPETVFEISVLENLPKYLEHELLG